MTVFAFHYIIGVKISLHQWRRIRLVIRNNIQKIRLERKISQVQMAIDLNVTRQTINAIEKERYNPSLELALKIMDYFQLPIEEIFSIEKGDEE